MAELKWWNNKNLLVGKKLLNSTATAGARLCTKPTCLSASGLSSETSRETRSILFPPCQSLKSQLRSQLTSQLTSQWRRKIQILLQVLTAEPTVEPPTQAPTVPPSKNPCLLSKWPANLMLAKESKTLSTGKPKPAEYSFGLFRLGQGILCSRVFQAFRCLKTLWRLRICEFQRLYKFWGAY